MRISNIRPCFPALFLPFLIVVSFACNHKTVERAGEVFKDSPAQNDEPIRTRPQDDQPLFPRDAPPLSGPRAVMEAELEGALVRDGDCLCVVTEADRKYTVIWPPRFRLQREEGDWWILNPEGDREVRVGQEVYLSGGGVPTEDMLAHDLQLYLRGRCKGPFWLTGDRVEGK